MPIKTVIIFLSFFIFVSCNKEERTYASIPTDLIEPYFNPSVLNKNKRSGKFSEGISQNMTYKLSSFDSIKLPLKFNIPTDVLELNMRLLENTKNKTYNVKGTDLIITHSDLVYVTQLINLYNQIPTIDISAYLDIYQLQGIDSIGNTLFTGYYTPNYDFQTKKSDPSYLPLLISTKSSDHIDTLCYVENEKILKNIRMQGSAMITINDSIKKHISYLREEKMISQDSSWSKILFKKRKTLTPYGATGIPLSANYSMAVDNNYIPLGGLALTLFPHKVAKHRILHEVRILSAQDTGGSIKGTGHVDIFHGAAEDAYESALRMHHYGKIFLLLPKKK